MTEIITLNQWQASIIACISFSPYTEKASILKDIRGVTVTPRKLRRFLPGGGETCTLPLDTRVAEPKKPCVPRWVIRHWAHFRPALFVGFFCFALRGLGVVIFFFCNSSSSVPASAAQHHKAKEFGGDLSKVCI